MNRQKDITIRVGGYYVGAEHKGKDYLTRHVIHMQANGECLWESYDTRTGEATRDSGSCAEGHLYNWAGREATPEEAIRMVKREPTLQEEHIENMKAIIVRELPDAELVAEARRRGYTIRRKLQ